MRYLISVVIIVLVLLVTSVLAQPLATPDQAFAWDYPDQMISDFNVVKFQIIYDGDTSNLFTVDLSNKVDPITYFHPLPPLVTGVRVANVRACRADNAVPDADGEVYNCGAWSENFTFRLGVFSAPVNTRIIDNPSQ